MQFVQEIKNGINLKFLLSFRGVASSLLSLSEQEYKRNSFLSVNCFNFIEFHIINLPQIGFHSILTVRRATALTFRYVFGVFINDQINLICFSTGKAKNLPVCASLPRNAPIHSFLAV